MEEKKHLQVVKLQPKVIQLILNRPDCHNALNPELLQQLYEQLISIAQDPDIRVVVLGTQGPHFSSGADLSWMQQSLNYTAEENYKDANLLAQTLYALDTLPQVTIAEVQGAAIGGALGLIACCDLSVASNQSKFRFSEVALGLVPAIISPYIIRNIGAKAARRWMLTAESFNSTQALNMALIDVVTTADKLAAQRQSWLQHILNNAPKALRVSKQLIRDVTPTINDTVYQHTVQTIAQCRTGEEAQLGLKAFLAKHPPPWKQH